MNPWLMNALNYGQTVLRTPAAQHMTKTALNLPLVYHAATFMDDDRLSANEKMRADQFGAGDINFSDTENYIGSEMIPGNQPLGFVDEGRDFSEFDQARMGNPTQTISTPLDIDKLRDPFAPLENEFMGPHDPSVYDRYGNIQMALEDEDFYENPKGLAQLFQNLNIDPSAWGTALKNKATTGWEFAKQLPGMAMSALGNIPGIGLGIGALRALARPDSPYQTFQKQMFEDMGWQGDSNKDPWGKNIRSLADTYDVTEQWGDLMGTKIGTKYGYEQAFADGVLSDEELAEMQAKGLKGWQLNRAIGLSQAAKKAQDWKDKKAAEKILTNQMKNFDGGGKTITYTPPTKQGKPGSWTPGGTYTGGGASWSPAGKSPSQNKGSSYSRGSYGGKGHHWAKGGRVGYANGGLASLFTRRG